MSKVIFVGDLHVSSRTPQSRLDDYGEVVLNKLESLRDLAEKKGADKIITTGDFFDVYHEPISYINRLMDTLMTFKDKNIEILSLIGNHDLPYNNMEYFNSTPLSLLFRSQAVTRLDRLEFDNVIIHGLHFSEREKFLENEEYYTLSEEKTDLLTLHYAIDNTVPNESIKTKDLKGFDIVVSGHDHMPYEVMNKNGVTVYRPGSFTRTTKEKYNLKRKNIIAYCFDTDTEEMEECYLPGVRPAEEVFKNDAFAEADLNLYDNKLNDLFSDKSFNYDSYDIGDILETLPPTVTKKSKEEVIKFLKRKGVYDDKEGAV